jgi:hypothetical protein
MSAVAVLYFHFHFSGNPVLQYLRPRFLPNRGHSKVVYRQAGTSLLILTLWLATTTATAFSLIPRSLLEHSRILMAVACFAIPVAVVMALVVSIYYLGVGIFARVVTVSPAFRSILETDAAQFDQYVKRMTRCTRINLTVLALTFGLPCLEALAGVEPKGIVVLVNVACLAMFILSLWRLRAYCVECGNIAGGIRQGRSAVYSWRPLGHILRLATLVCSAKTIRRVPEPIVEATGPSTACSRCSLEMKSAAA